MKFIKSILFFLFFQQLLCAQTFQKTYDFCDIAFNGADENGEYVTETENGFIVIATNRFSCLSIIELNHSGEVLRNKEIDFYPVTFWSIQNGFLKDENGDFFIVGASDSMFVDRDILLLKISGATLDTLWTQRYSIEHHNVPSAIKFLSKDKLLIFAVTDSLGGNFIKKNEFLFLEVDTSGTLLDTFTMEGSEGSGIKSIDLGDIQVLPGGDMMIAYYTFEPGWENYEGVRCLLNSNYEKVWCDTISTIIDQIVISRPEIAVSPDSSVIYTAWVRGRPWHDRFQPNESIVVQAITKDNELIWERELWYGTSYLTSLIVTDVGDIVGSGIGIGESFGLQDFKGRIFKLNSDGEVEFYHMIKINDALPFNDSLDGNDLYDVIATSDGGYFAAGDIEPPSTNSDPRDLSDVYVVKLDENGCLVPTCDSIVKDISMFSTSTQDLSINTINVFPNPSTGEIYFQLSNKIPKATFNLYSLAGKKVVDAELDRGDESVDISFLPKGIYFYKITTIDGEKIGQGKLVKQ